MAEKHENNKNRTLFAFKEVLQIDFTSQGKLSREVSCNSL